MTSETSLQDAIDAIWSHVHDAGKHLLADPFRQPSVCHSKRIAAKSKAA